MSIKSERVEARLSPRDRELIDQAAELEGESLSSFIITAAAEKAERLIAARMTSVLPGEYFDRLISAIDEADRAPHLARAAKRARQRQRLR